MQYLSSTTGQKSVNEVLIKQRPCIWIATGKV